MADPVSDSADTNNDGHRDISTGGAGVGRPGHLGMMAPGTERDAPYGVGGCF
jgi:hypothetical protein